MQTKECPQCKGEFKRMTKKKCPLCLTPLTYFGKKRILIVTSKLTQARQFVRLFFELGNKLIFENSYTNGVEVKIMLEMMKKVERLGQPTKIIEDCIRFAYTSDEAWWASYREGWDTLRLFQGKVFQACLNRVVSIAEAKKATILRKEAEAQYLNNPEMVYEEF